MSKTYHEAILPYTICIMIYRFDTQLVLHHKEVICKEQNNNEGISQDQFCHVIKKLENRLTYQLKIVKPFDQGDCKLDCL